MKQINLITAVTWTALAMPLTVQAKGLEELKPTDKSSISEPASNVKKFSPASPDSTNLAKPEPSSNDEKPAKSNDLAAKTQGTAEKKAAPSAASKALDNRLELSTGLGYMRISDADLGEFDASGLADFAMGLRLTHSKQAAKFYVQLRYAPVYVDSRVDQHSYRGMIEGYYLGPAVTWRIAPGLRILALAELGYLIVNLYAIEASQSGEDIEKNEFAYTIGSGLDWALGDKINVGPRIYGGFGAYQTIQASVAGTFIF